MTRPSLFLACFPLLLAACDAGSLSKRAAEWPADRAENQVQLLRFRNGEGRPLGVEVPTCGQRKPVITPDSIGPLRAGQALGSLRDACGELYYGWDLGDEGVPAPAVAVRLAGAVVTAELDSSAASSHVVAVTVEHGSARTPDGFGPGSSLGELVRAWGAPALFEGNCVIEAVFPGREGLVWRLDLPGRPECADVAAIARGGAVDRLPPETLVSRVTQVFHAGP